MPLSERRADAPVLTDELNTPAEGDFNAFVTFTQRRTGDPHLIAGNVDAPDESMALIFAKEHYGQDQECVSIWAFPAKAIAGTHADHPTSSKEGPVRRFQVFTQKRSGDLLTEAGTVQAPHSESALQAARQMLDDADALHCIWIVDWDDIIATDDGEMIWRNTDQTYRLARGYSKDVRRKWEAIRAARDVDEYQSEDLKEMF